MDEQQDQKEWLYYLNLAFSLGFTISFTIAAGGALGYGFDKWLLGQSVGFGFVCGLLLGVVAGFYQAYRLIMRKGFWDES